MGQGLGSNSGHELAHKDVIAGGAAWLSSSTWPGGSPASWRPLQVHSKSLAGCGLKPLGLDGWGGLRHGQGGPQAQSRGCTFRTVGQALGSVAFTSFPASQGSGSLAPYLASVFLTFKDLGESMVAPVAGGWAVEPHW